MIRRAQTMSSMPSLLPTGIEIASESNALMCEVLRLFLPSRRQTRRTANLRATTEARVLSIARQDFIALVERMPLLRAALDRTRYRDRRGTGRAGHG